MRLRQPTFEANSDQLEQVLAIADISRTVNDFRPLPETMELICERVAGMPACDWVTISLLDTERRETKAWGDPRIHPEFMEWSRADPSRHKGPWSPTFMASSSGRPLLIPDVYAQPEWATLARGAQIQGWTGAAYVPISASGRGLGTLNCYSRRRHEHSDNEVRLLQTVARLVGIAAETALIAEHHRQVATENERLSLEISKRNDELSWLSQAQMALAEALLASGHDTAQSLCDLLWRDLGRSAMICALDGKPRTFAGEDEARPLMVEALLHRDPVKLASLDDGTPIGLCSVHRIEHDHLLGLLLFHPPLVDPGHGTTVLLKHALALIAFELESERSDRTMREVARPSVLHSVARGLLSPSQARTAAAFVDATGQQLRIGFTKTVDDRDASQLAHRLNRMAKGGGCLAASPEHDGVLFLIEDGPSTRIRQTLATWLDNFGGIGPMTGLSESFSDMASAAGALEQARMMIGIASPGQVAIYDEVGPTADLLKQLPKDQAAAFVERMLTPLLNKQDSRGGTLVDSVAAYLDRRGSLRLASGDLGVHPNTLQLRLARAAKLTGLDFHDPLQMGLLALAIRWRRLLGSA